MLPLLTKYLLHYKKVSIPGIGSFYIEQQPAELNFIDRLLMPPHYKIVFNDRHAVDDDLVTYIGSLDEIDETTAQKRLVNFGTSLKNKLLQEPFEWNGIGKLEYSNGVVFHPKKINNNLQPVPANKVVRENQQHTVLVGEQEYQSGDIEQSRLNPKIEKRRISVAVLAGSILLFLALAFLGYYIYKHQSVNGSTGFKTLVQPKQPSSTYK